MLSKLLDEPLSSVVFVADYLQLDFNGSRFTAYAWPKVLIGTSTWEFGDSGYRDALCAFIAHEVVATEESPGVGLVLRFRLGLIITNPEPSELSGPEIAQLSVYVELQQTTEWSVWRPGEGTFANRDWS